MQTVKMKLNLFIFIVMSFCHILSFRPTNENNVPQILSYEFVRHPNSSYYYKYETSDGQEKSEIGDFIDIDGKKVLSVVGNYKFTSLDGEEYHVRYTSGINGFELLPDDGFELDDRIDQNLIKTLLG